MSLGNLTMFLQSLKLITEYISLLHRTQKWLVAESVVHVYCSRGMRRFVAASAASLGKLKFC